MAFITVELLSDFANKFAAKITERFAKKTDIPDIPEGAVFTDTTYGDMGGASVSKTGTSGLTPAPPAGAQGKFLRGDGTWQTPAGTEYGEATSSKAGLMSSLDKAKLDGMEEASQTDIDSIISDTFK